ncbi:MAG: rhodanese-like domain-containing protein [Pseudomonadota bacterium]|nr:rhodanese-like domain-containing protein [Pseudomonadota bacterium]
MGSKLTNFLSWKPLEVGEPATPLSLTADDGTWIKLDDFKGHLNVLLVFFRSLTDADTDAWLRVVDAARSAFEGLDTAVFGVNTARTDELRAHRARIGTEFFLLYDPLALAARGFRASGRIRPLCKDTAVLVGKNGKVLYSERGHANVAKILAAAARAEGKEAPAAPPPPPPAAASGSGALRTPGRPAPDVLDIDSQQALALLGESDSPFLLVDVRTKSEFESDRSPLARHIPVDELPHRYGELGQTNHVIFVCQGGGRSAAAAEFMTSLGSSNIYNVVGGMSQWTGPRERAARTSS